LVGGPPRLIPGGAGGFAFDVLARFGTMLKKLGTPYFNITIVDAA
jgi:hypothetical protein